MYTFYVIKWVTDGKEHIGSFTYATYEAARESAMKTSKTKDKYKIVECAPIKGD